MAISLEKILLILLVKSVILFKVYKTFKNIFKLHKELKNNRECFKTEFKCSYKKDVYTQEKTNIERVSWHTRGYPLPLLLAWESMSYDDCFKMMNVHCFQFSLLAKLAVLYFEYYIYSCCLSVTISQTYKVPDSLST